MPLGNLGPQGQEHAQPQGAGFPKTLRFLGPWPNWVVVFPMADPSDQPCVFQDPDAQSVARFLRKMAKKYFQKYTSKPCSMQTHQRADHQCHDHHLGQAGNQDVVLIFIAGHGIQHRQSGSYYFLTHEPTLTPSFPGLRMSDFDEAIKIIQHNSQGVVL